MNSNTGNLARKIRFPTVQIATKKRQTNILGQKDSFIIRWQRNRKHKRNLDTNRLQHMLVQSRAVGSKLHANMDVCFKTFTVKGEN